ncbi:MAG: polyphosphate:AMP phosphotransferase [Lachnospiraceae bacterium]
MLNLKNDNENKMKKSELKAEIRTLQEKLVVQQLQLKEHKLPVLILIEGWGASGKGELIARMIKDLDPRFFHVYPMKQATEEDKKKPFLSKFMDKIPEAGKITILDSGWLEETADSRFHGEFTESEWENRLQTIRVFERQLKDNGYLLVKFYLHLTKKEQEKRLSRLLNSKDTAWRVNDQDMIQYEERTKYKKIADQILEATNTESNPWKVINGADPVETLYESLHVLTAMIEQAIANIGSLPEILFKDNPLIPMPKLAEVPLNQEMSQEEYKKEKKELQKRLSELHNRLYRKKIPFVIVYEGWDAAGKGGNIKRLTGSLDPRGYEVNPVASPEPHEKSRFYLWRFWLKMPKKGHFAIFDRSWYGRVMVERVEGFCSENDWKRAYNEINEFEKQLADEGTEIVKFWVQIDKETQLWRFEERQKTPSKQWKITDEDWRNREKWDAYETVVNEMLERTSTKYAPWYIVPSNNKYYARIFAMRTIVEHLERRLKS